jgi:hypothetical protein
MALSGSQLEAGKDAVKDNTSVEGKSEVVDFSNTDKNTSLNIPKDVQRDNTYDGKEWQSGYYASPDPQEQGAPAAAPVKKTNWLLYGVLAFIFYKLLSKKKRK